MTESGKEGVCHAAADDEGVNLGKKVGDNADFIGNLCAAEDCNKGSLRVFKRAADVFKLLLNEEAANSGKIIGNAGG